MPGVRVLIVEDDADINQIVATHLARRGMACTQAFSGSEARLLIEGGEGAFPFDIVVSDLMLPGMPGEELVGLIRERDARVRPGTHLRDGAGQAARRRARGRAAGEALDGGRPDPGAHCAQDARDDAREGMTPSRARNTGGVSWIRTTLRT